MFDTFMDGLPVIEHLERLNEAFVRSWWHWWFLGQTEKPAEAFISADPDRWYQTPPPEQMGEGNHADAWAAFRDPAVVHGMCEDYRAGLRVDRAHEEADRAAGRKITCPVLLLVSADDDLDIHGDPETIWRPWTAEGLRSHLIHSGHHQAEEAPEEVASALLQFLTLLWPLNRPVAVVLEVACASALAMCPCGSMSPVLQLSRRGTRRWSARSWWPSTAAPALTT
jgi:haloacetate dehalogenase